ncbi:MAG: hypothetical protein HKN33_03725 [Pyrinomonadaceae bacterium]|nr:hypothetical protein [Pyrinomonadaceae bacterium]
MCSSESSTPPQPSTTPNADRPAGATNEPCPEDCTRREFSPREVNESISETISNAPAPYTAWNGTYGWRSKFTVQPDRASCAVRVIVKIKVRGTVTETQKAAWKSAIEGKWNGKAKLVCPDPACEAACPNGYAIRIELQYVDRGEHYTVTANQPTATEGGRAGIGGTTSMTGWGVGDTTDVTHEFGHMLGCPEEYFTTDGVDYTEGGTKTGFRDPGGGIMNNPSGNPTTANYELVRQNAASAMGLTCTTETA